MKNIVFLFLSIFCMHSMFAQNASIKEETLNMKTYMFSEPDPVPNISRIYPYFRFDSYAAKGEYKDWNMVVLENKYIKVYVCPAVGGKVWGAIEKSTGKEFLYYNDVVKFRDVAMRGAWTSGGLEYNFGDIGHIPTCATPVDYAIKENKDGSVSCIVGAIDLPSRTKWNVEISLQKDQAFFETKASWFNTSSVPVTYYHWMNAAAKAKGDLEFIYPGNKRIGHGGELGEWNIDNDRDISMYENNNFGVYKSYHVINNYSDFFGGYWHEDDFGFGHHSSYDDKPGKKIWIWGLSDQGMIWEDLLTDTKGQYVEYQSGKLFNQAANSSTKTPYKHKEFSPFDTDVMTELWFPLKGTKGMVAASEHAVLNVERNGNTVNLFLSPLQSVNAELVVKVDNKIVFNKKIERETLELVTDSFVVDNSKDFEVELGDKLLIYKSNKEANIANRPVDPNAEFNWDSSYGLYIKGLEFEKQRRYNDAQKKYLESYKKEPSFVANLNRIALSYFRLGNQSKALEFVNKALSIDTYDGLANYLFGLINAKLKKANDAKSGFAIASQEVSFRSAAYTELAKIYLSEHNLEQAKRYTQKALNFNAYNISAVEMNAVIHRKENNKTKALSSLAIIDELDETSHFSNFERYLHESLDIVTFNNQISNELPFESYLELASKYIAYGCKGEALNVLNNAPKNAIVLLWKAYLDNENQNSILNEALVLSTDMIFPHRKETGEILEYFIENNSHWKLKYYLGLQQWNTGNLEVAKHLFKQCKEAPTNIPFYLSKIKLFDFDNEITLSSLKKASEINQKDWRLNLAWMQYYKRTNQLILAKKLAKETYKKHTDNATIGMFYAKILMSLGEFDTCLKFLENFEVLPFEGATEGRNIYHESCIKLSLKYFEKGNYEKSLKYAQKATLWPKNLGVGKHYDVDERLDNFLIATSFEKLEDKKESTTYFNKIINHKTPDYQNESSNLYFQLLVAKKHNKEDLFNQLVNKYAIKAKENKYLKWVLAHFNNDNEDEIYNDILNSKKEIQIYDTKFVDANFKLVTEVIDRLRIN